MPEVTEPNPSNQERLSDWGPRYTETPSGDYPFTETIVEPWNTVTASFFILIVIYWLFFLRGRYRQFPLMVCCLPILLAGGIGGTIYHGTRSHAVFFLLDLVPINILAVILSIYLWMILGPKITYLLGMVIMLFLMNILGRLALPGHGAINVSYASLAAMVLLPIILFLIRTRFLYWRWIICSLLSFLLALAFRILDAVDPPILPMGTHWLWHIAGAICTFCMSEYFYRIEKEKIPAKVREFREVEKRSKPDAG